jgi:hypothetical protein
VEEVGEECGTAKRSESEVGIAAAVSLVVDVDVGIEFVDVFVSSLSLFALSFFINLLGVDKEGGADPATAAPTPLASATI